ncbi:MAG: hypothetical protein GX577_05170 [Leptolinea sp.]|nr:hypothetical protein [Leptolinea sp.]
MKSRLTRIIFYDPGKSDYWKTHEKPLRFLGWFLLLLGMGSVLLYGQTHRLTCNRQPDGSVECSGQIFWFDAFALTRPEFINTIVGAEPAIHCDSVGRIGRYDCEFTEVSIQNSANSMTISANFLNTRTARESADRINEFLGDPFSQSLIIINRNNWIAIPGFVCVMPPFVLLGIILIVGQKTLIRQDYAAPAAKEHVSEQ